MYNIWHLANHTVLSVLPTGEGTESLPLRHKSLGKLGGLTPTTEAKFAVSSLCMEILFHLVLHCIFFFPKDSDTKLQWAEVLRILLWG